MTILRRLGDLLSEIFSGPGTPPTHPLGLGEFRSRSRSDNNSDGPGVGDPSHTEATGVTAAFLTT